MLNNHPPFITKTILVSMLLAISACGGGGDSTGEGGTTPENNVVPTASAGIDQTVESGVATVTLTGSGVDTDGTISSFSWTESTGSIAITDSTLASATFTAPTVSADTTFTFTLTVTDNEGATATDEIIVTVSAPAVIVNLESTLDSDNWTVVNHTPEIRDVVFTGSKYWAVGSSGYIASSTDGLSWTEVDIASTVSFEGIAANGMNAVAIPYNNAQAATPNSFVATTTDGTNWQIHSGFESTDCIAIYSVSHDGSQFVGIFDNNKICTSTDGSSWQLQSTENSLVLNDIVFGAGKYAITFSDGLMIKDSLSSTASDIPSLPLPSSGAISDLQFGNSIFVGIRSGEIMYSSDAASWSAVSSSTIPEDIHSVSYSSGKGFIAISTDNYPVLYSSTDGINWSLVSGSNAPLFGGFFSTIVNGDNEALLFTHDSLIYRSTDQAAWDVTTAVHPTERLLSSNYYFKRNNTLLVQTNDGLYRTTDSGANWSLISDFPGGIISMDNTRLFAGGGGGVSYSDDDGVTWNSAIAFNSFDTLSASVKLGTTTYTFTDNGQFSQQKPVLTSDDGITFQVDNGLFTGSVIASNYLGNVQQAVSSSSVIVGITHNTIVSYDGSNWIAPEMSLDTLKDVVFNGTNFVVVGASGLVMTSADGATWATQTWLNSTATITDILVVNSDLYATDSLGKIAKSTDDGLTWVLSKDLQAATVLVNNVVTELVYNSGNGTIFGFGSNTSNMTPVSIIESSDNGASWSVDTYSSVQSDIAGHLFYDASNTRYVTVTGLESTDLLNWSVLSQYPDDASFSYIGTQEELSGRGYSSVIFTAGVGGAADSYISGAAAFSNDGLNWVIKIDLPDLPMDPDFTGGTHTGLVAGVSTLDFVKYVNGQYIGIALDSSSSKTGFYTSADASNWSLTTEQYINGAGPNVLDIEYDGSQYLISLYESGSGTGLDKGMLIIKTSDLQILSLFETGLRVPLSDLYVDADGYTLIGQEATISTRPFYQ